MTEEFHLSVGSTGVMKSPDKIEVLWKKEAVSDNTKGTPSLRGRERLLVIYQ